MPGQEYDYMIIGGGSAAFAAAHTADKLGVKTVLIEKGNLGGTCINAGCVPTKYLLNLASKYYYANRKGFPGLTFEASLDFKKVIEGKDALVKRLRVEKYQSVLKAMSKNVDYIHGSASFTEPKTIVANGQKVSAKKILIATGSAPFIPPISGVQDIRYLTSNKALELSELPKSITIIGAGAVGLEFAQMFAHFGSKVTLIQDLPRLLPKEEPEISSFLHAHLASEKIRIYTGSLVESIRSDDNQKYYTRVQTGKDVLEIESEKVLISTGRRANTGSINVKEAGIQLGKKSQIVVNERYETSAEDIYAAGDVIGEPMLETVAAREGVLATENALLETSKTIDYNTVPRTIFTSPQLTTIGMTERLARSKEIDYQSKIVEVSLLPKAQIINRTEGLSKIIIDKADGTVLGVHVLSHMSSDIIQEAVLAVKNRLKVKDIVETAHIFPTMAELIKYSAQAFFKDVGLQPCCTD